MNNKTLYFIVFVMIFLFPFSVKADECSDSKILELKEAAKNIEINYEYNKDAKSTDYIDDYEEGEIIDDLEPVIDIKGAVNLIITGLPKGMYIEEREYGRFFHYDMQVDGKIIIEKVGGGTKSFAVYSNECYDEIRSISIDVPKYNIYHEDPLCEGISGDDLAVCGEFYNGDISYETFKASVEQYKSELSNKKSEDKSIDDTSKNSNVDKVVNKVSSTLEDYYIYIIAGVVLLVAIVIFIRVRRKRSVLE